MISHGCVRLLKANLSDLSDGTYLYVCENCGMISYHNQKRGTKHCTKCEAGESSSSISRIHAPYAMKLLSQELNAMNIGTIFDVVEWNSRERRGGIRNNKE
jgi:DNA-directed RNA polymerase beta subunit